LETVMLTSFKKFLADQRGATAIEYGLIAVVLSLVIVSGVQGYGNSMQNMFARISGTLDDH
jgi:pilus assembly protein Flp/PilA